MQTIIFLGSNKSGSSREALKAAKSLGYFIVLLTDREKWIKQQREEFTDVHQMIYMSSLTDKKAILKKISCLKKQGKQIKAFMSFIDPLVSLAADISRELNLAELSVEALFNMEDKTRFREVLKENQASPFYAVCSIEEGEEKLISTYSRYLPFIIKSPVSNGSKDVLLISSQEQFKKAIRRFQKRYPGVPVLIEEYLDGPQYLIEVLVKNSHLHIVAVIEQEITKFDRFIITGYSLPALLPNQACKKLHAAVKSILEDLKLSNGTCHLEMRFVKGEWKLIEINPRISGGPVNQAIFAATGINLVKETIKLNLGEEPMLIPLKREFAFVQMVTVPSSGRLVKVTGKNRAKDYEGVKEVYIKPRKGMFLTPPLSMGHRYAYVLASARQSKKAKQIAQKAAKEITFVLEPEEGDQT
ncbi:ATP-grasp domain-containing protein [Domibacillus sp. DTU_2020_1001157_1_SI_ALB_TIR_016]|uniref:ATP-grasp domain-containing protein n=1 Tax=Domibacillus sp. DTU_2020_1001157_1_SI_ALB_TIR_016 TaxID=3077789 RepID=UPI0028EACB2D|nr:ATP-grasp domain-containing protein [Domibacillus sp. DTU_2020_1001157_1_SI_ALB_TIR_016]WNS80373.1 ATP-grasp domain-containing protein [Domibacillus sp. DTU_2020_1001157_1_SI_ALB_TIR_016]